MSRRKSGVFDEDGRKIYSTNSPCYAGTREAGPACANPPRWQASVMRAWAIVDRRDAEKRREQGREPLKTQPLVEVRPAA